MRSPFFAFAVLLQTIGFLSAEDPIPAFHSTVGLEVEDFYEASPDPIELKLYFYRAVDRSSLNDNDLWVVSRNGFSELATFVSAAPLGGDEPPQGEVDTLGTVATYQLEPPENGWTESNNGRYVVLLQPDEVQGIGGSFFPPDYLGSFRIGVGETRPAYPSGVGIEVKLNADGERQAVVTYRFDEGRIHVTDFGQIERHGNRLTIDFQAIHSPDGEEAPVEFVQNYPLTDLESGHYELIVQSGSRVLGVHEFRVFENGEPIEAEIELEVQSDPNGRHYAIVVVHFHDSHLGIMEPGDPIWDGNRIIIHAKAGFRDHAEFPGESTFKWRYDLGFLPPGPYSLSFKINDQLCPHIDFKVGERGEIPATANIDIVRTEEKIAAQVKAEISPNADGSIYQIGEWGRPWRQGQTIYLDAKANGPLESFNIEPITQRHEYCLFDKSPNKEWEELSFEPLELLPDYLRPAERHEVVLRTEEEWDAWIGEIWPPDIDADAPPIPVDFETHTVVAIYLGRQVEGAGAEFDRIVTNGQSIDVRYVEWTPGIIEGEEISYHYPGLMAAIRKTDLPVTFNGRTPTGDPPVAHTDSSNSLGWPGPDDAGVYLVIFRINGIAYARARFEISGGGGKIPARANIEVTQDGEIAEAEVEVAFTGFPYHSISEWGPVECRGNHFIIHSQASEIHFVREPALPYFERHRFRLPLAKDDDGEAIDFEIIDINPQIAQQQNVVIQTRDQWWELIGFEPGPNVLPAPDPVDFEEFTLIGVIRGVKPTGCYGLKIIDIAVRDGVILTTYQLRDPRPNELCVQATTYPALFAAIEKTESPIDFIELPDPGFDAPPIPVEPDGGIGDGGGPLPPLEPGDVYTVEFRIDDLTYAETKFVIEDEDDRIPARATLKLEEGNASVAAHVEVAFTGFPYHSITDWGSPVRSGDLFQLNATASEVQFFEEPELPYFERHTYRLPVYAVPECMPLDFERLESPIQVLERKRLHIQTVDEWWDFLGVEPGPLVDPIPPPVNLSEFTIIGVFLGERPDTCYGVKIQEVCVEEGKLRVVYKLREPREGEGCGDAITYPGDLVAIEKSQVPVEFIELPDDGEDGVFKPVDGEPGDGSGAEPLPVDADGNRVIMVEFRINGVVYAHERLRLNDDGTEGPSPNPVLPHGFVDWLGQFDSGNTAGGDQDAPSEADFASMNRDGDRWTDLEEFLLGLNPVDPGGPPPVRPEWIQDEAGPHLAICFQRRKGAEEHVDFVVEASNDLRKWIDDPTLLEHVNTLDLGGDLEEVTICLKATADAPSAHPFLRLVLRSR